MHRFMIKAVRSSVVLALGALCLTAPLDSNNVYFAASKAEAATNQTAVVTGTYVNLRGGPSTNNPIQGQAKQGDKLSVLSKQGDWYQVQKADGQAAWIAGWLVRVESSPITSTPTVPVTPTTTGQTAVVTGSFVNLRGGPGTGYAIQGQANQGDKLPVLGKQGDWLKISKSDGKEAWIASWLVKVESTQVTPTPTPTPTPVVTTPTTAETAVVTGSYVNLRGGPGTGYAVQGQVNQGDKLPVLGKQGDWLKLKTSDGREVWMAGWLARVESGVSEPVATTPTTPPSSTTPSRGDGVDRGPNTWLPNLPPTQTEENEDTTTNTDKVELKGPKLTDIDVEKDGDKTIITVEAETKLQFNTFMLTNPNRMVINFDGVCMGDVAESQTVNSSTVKELRTGQFSAEPLVARMVLDLTGQVTYRTSTSNQGKVLEIEITEVKYDNSVAGKLIFIDAGHGGNDPGAPGYSRNTWEENDTLNMALKLEALLKQQGARVEMSRTSDQTVGLSDRPAMANSINADIFVSIHCNANNSSSLQGTSAYFYAPSSRADLYAQRADRQRLAQNIQNEMVGYAGLSDKNIREANFAVLRESKMPSVLVETAFISNPQEEKLLSDSNFQQKVAEAIARGINTYFSGK